MPQTFDLVDAFTAEPFAGNPAAVYVLDCWPDDAWLQAVAREMNQSETAFVVRNQRRISSPLVHAANRGRSCAGTPRWPRLTRCGPPALPADATHRFHYQAVVP